jgi:tRNA/rRNA methyltransferase
LITGGPAIILVAPQLSVNIGMVARAMANFGLSELRLVTPRDPWPSEEARAAASRADHVIDQTRVYDTLAAAIADLSFVVATTARDRDGFKPVRGPVEATQEIGARMNTGQRCGILFGRERWGLENEEISLADEICTFPVNPAFASLNIAQAVLLMSYEWMKLTGEPVATAKTEFVPADKQQLTSLFDYIEPTLEARGYFRTDAKKAGMIDNLRAVLTRPGFTAKELSVLRGLFVALDKFSPRKPRGSGPPEGD